ncbi:MAG: hypothetical protein U0360_10300 [Dehalococcoidia bacterium]
MRVGLHLERHTLDDLEAVAIEAGAAQLAVRLDLADLERVVVTSRIRVMPRSTRICAPML